MQKIGTENEALVFADKTMLLLYSQVLGTFSDCQFFMSESCNPEAMNVPVIFEGETPFMYFFKAGLEEEKVVSFFCKLCVMA